MESRHLKIGDVVQINPENNEVWGGMLVVVTEPKEWGCQGYLMSHDDFLAIRVKKTGKAFVRVNFENIEFVGSLFWILEDKEEIEDVLN